MDFHEMWYEHTIKATPHLYMSVSYMSAVHISLVALNIGSWNIVW
jgi:hypothetical protein